MDMLSIGQVARRAGVVVETVRLYEREGELSEPPRRASRYRQYSEQVVRCPCQMTCLQQGDNTYVNPRAL